MRGLLFLFVISVIFRISCTQSDFQLTSNNKNGNHLRQTIKFSSDKNVFKTHDNKSIGDSTENKFETATVDSALDSEPTNQNKVTKVKEAIPKNITPEGTINYSENNYIEEQIQVTNYSPEPDPEDLVMPTITYSQNLKSSTDVSKDMKDIFDNLSGAPSRLPSTSRKESSSSKEGGSNLKVSYLSPENIFKTTTSGQLSVHANQLLWESSTKYSASHRSFSQYFEDSEEQRRIKTSTSSALEDTFNNAKSSQSIFETSNESIISTIPFLDPSTKTSSKSDASTQYITVSSNHKLLHSLSDGDILKTAVWNRSTDIIYESRVPTSSLLDYSTKRPERDTSMQNEHYPTFSNDFSEQSYSDYEDLIREELSTTDDHQTTTTSFVTIPTTTCSIPPSKVKDLKASDGTNYVNLSWELPMERTCLSSFRVFVNDIFRYELNKEATSTSVTISQLEFCERYIFSIVSYNADIAGESASIFLKLDPPKSFVNETINNLEIFSGNNILFITWLPPDTYTSCVTGYLIREGYINATTNVPNITNEFMKGNADQPYFSSDSLSCIMYYVEIAPMASNLNGSTSNGTFVVPIPTPILRITTWGKTWAEFEVKLEENYCEFISTNISCIAPKDRNINKPWIISNVQESFPFDGTEGLSYKVNVTGFSEFSNMTCSALVEDYENISPNSNEVSFQTSEEVPSPPTNLTTLELNSRSFLISWDEPEKLPGILSNYDLIIINEGPQHFIPEDCHVPIMNVTIQVVGNEFHFKMGSPNFLYNVILKAGDRVGYGESIQLAIRTPVSDPERCRNISLSTITYQNDPTLYNVTENISWMLPCNTNGPLEEFIVRISGEYSQNKSSRLWYNETFTQKSLEQKVLYNHSILNLNASYLYTVQVISKSPYDFVGPPSGINFTSSDGYPERPRAFNASGVTDEQFQLTWEEPHKTNGKLLFYRLHIISVGPNYFIPNDNDCIIHNISYLIEITPTSKSIIFNNTYPSFQYNVSIEANTSMGSGLNASTVVNTLSGVPSSVRNLRSNIVFDTSIENYNARVDLNFLRPCYTNGEFDSFEISYFGYRKDFSNHTGKFTGNTTSFNLIVRPEYVYDFEITVRNKAKLSNSTQLHQISSPSGVPLFKDLSKIKPPIANGTDQAIFLLKKEIFNETNGIIRYCALLIEEYSESDLIKPFGFWNNSERSWPKPCFTEQCKNASQLTSIRWNPFAGGQTEINFTIGANTNNCKDNYFCNRELKAGNDYLFIVRTFTANFYSDSPPMRFKTDPISEVKLALILGLVFSFLTLGLIGLYIYFVWKRNKTFKNYFSGKLIESEQTKPTPSYYNILQTFLNNYYDLKKNNFLKLKQEYASLNAKTKELTPAITYAMLPENKRKNRYTNILTFDATRVKLKIDEDDEIGSDYINASYIKGYSGNIEYIATQGPLESTCRDFWKMIIQEKVTVIAMVSQFVERDKEKCYRYFPKNHESITINDDIEIKCVSELHFGTHCVRTLQVRKDSEHHSVTHMQFLDWPDFDCPAGTEQMTRFCLQFRERLKREGGLGVVHCSAGVGRTGTLIAVDILIQTAKDSKDINVFDTILELRKQRVNMVQTEKQYFYIYMCIKEHIENPVMISNEKLNHSHHDIRDVGEETKQTELKIKGTKY